MNVLSPQWLLHQVALSSTSDTLTWNLNFSVQPHAWSPIKWIWSPPDSTE
uniref:Uncharacterized protein n=1 Tax=Anguilla anguilla TaxID=7936 RepID=A0A0E9UVW7_ANGAN